MKTFPMLNNSVGFYGTLYFYAALSIVMLFWGVFTIENNEDLSLVEVEKKIYGANAGSRDLIGNRATRL